MGQAVLSFREIVLLCFLRDPRPPISETIWNDLGKIQNDLGKIQNDLGKIQNDLGKIQNDLGKIQNDLGKIPE